SSRRRHTRFSRDWSSDVCSSDLTPAPSAALQMALASLGHYYSQADLFSLENPDTRPPVMGANHTIVRWGDPYTNYVGNVNGSDRSEERRVGKECREHRTRQQRKN